MTTHSTPSTITTPVSWAAAIVDTLSERGIDSKEILQSLAIDEALLRDHTQTVPQDLITRLWELAVVASGDVNIGFAVGKRIHTVLNPLVAYSLMSCANLKESCERLARYQELVAEGLSFTLVERGTQFALIFNIAAGALSPSPQAIKSTLAAFFSFISWVTFDSVKPTAATLQQAAPTDDSDYSRLFLCPISFAATENCFYFSKHDLLAPLATADPSLREHHELQLQGYQRRRSLTLTPSHLSLKPTEAMTFSAQVSQLLKKQLPSGEPAQDDIALLLGVSSSTLKRRLRSEQINFSTLLDDTRHAMALHYLAINALPLTEITYLLGFSQSSVFTRAFKRWQGISPSQFRAQALDSQSLEPNRAQQIEKNPLNPTI